MTDRFKQKRKVRIIIEDNDDEMGNKVNLLKKAFKDPLFLTDIGEISADFESIDKESL